MYLFLTLTTIHFVTDFMLQGWGIGVSKRGFNWYMLVHVIITSILPIFPIFLFGYSLQKILLMTLLTFVSHLLIDITKQEINVKYKLNFASNYFWTILGVDQILHILFIFIGIKYIFV